MIISVHAVTSTGECSLTGTVVVSMYNINLGKEVHLHAYAILAGT
jgi:hypothetical protein